VLLPRFGVDREPAGLRFVQVVADPFCV
jgi:hypothetical protein